MNNHFFAYLSKMRWIYRWGMKRNAIQENIMEHSYEVSVIAHALGIISNRLYGNNIDANALAISALYHDCSEVLTGDLPSPIKYHNTKIRDAYKEVEYTAEREMLSTLPLELQEDYRNHLLHENISSEFVKFIKAADIIASLIKCKAEINAGNSEFKQAVRDTGERLTQMAMPEVDYFLENFLPSFDLTLDELITPSETMFPDNK
ncbi:MAG: 5'-deoxynucleotidase [Cellvibrionales bacterium]|nr:5'-deoxynucleotidase [Cellvibrionales bacterium]